MSLAACYFFLLLACSVGGAAGQRNAAAEQVCQSFLVSPASSPLLPAATRNLTVDEDAEFECELVLQDRHLPAQIRLTVWLLCILLIIFVCVQR